MAIYYNPNTYDIGAASPIDSRFTKPTNVLRNAIPPAVRYEGLSVYVVNPAGDGSIPGTTYTLVGGILDTNWTVSSLLGGLWGLSGGAITNAGSTDVAITTSLIVPKIKPSVNSVTAIQLTAANGTTVIVNLDTTNNRVGINNIAPVYDLDVTGSIQASSNIFSPTVQTNSVVALTSTPLLTISTKPGVAQGIVIVSKGVTPTETARFTTDGRFGLGVTLPTALMHLAAGSITANTAPIKLTSGALTTIAEAGAIEFLADAYYATITTGSVRKQFAFTSTTLSGYGITDAVLKAGDTMTGALQIGVAADNKLILQHNYTTSPAGASYIKWMDESSVLLGTIGLAPTTKALTLTSNAVSPLIVLNSPTLVNNGIQIGDATTTITKDGSNNLVFTDVVSGSKTLAQLLTAGTWSISGNDIQNTNTGNVGVGALPTAGYKLDVAGNFRYTGKISSVVAGSAVIDIEAKSASGYKLRFYDVTNSINLLHINQLGYVGINTNAQIDQFAVVANTTGIYAGNITNSHVTGKGLYVGGASGSLPSLLVADYLGNSLFTVTPTDIVGTKPISSSNLSGTNTGDQAFTSGGAIGIGFFFDDTSILATGPQNDNKVGTLAKTPITSAEQLDTIVVLSGVIVIDETYLYDFALGRTIIDAGVWTFNTYCSTSSTAGTSTLINKLNRVIIGTGTIDTTGIGMIRTATATSGTPFSIMNIDVSGTVLTDSFLQTTTGLFRILSRVTDTQITISVPATYTNQVAVVYSIHKALFAVSIPVTTTVLTLVSVQVVQPAFPINITDKFSSMMLATASLNHTITFSHNGTTRYTNFQTPLITLHNNLAGLQGGTATERYHITTADATTWNAKQSTLNGTGFIKATGTVISYDNTAYAPIASPSFTGVLTHTSTANQSIAWGTTNVNGTYLGYYVNGVAKAYIGSRYHLQAAIAGYENDFEIRAEGALSFGTGNGEKMVILANGNVGIGIALPDSHLHVGLQNGAALRINYANTGDNYFDGVYHRFRDSGGSGEYVVFDGVNRRVGIGTASPTSALHVSAPNTGTLPATSGSIQTGGILRLQHSANTSILDIGADATGIQWIQATNIASLNTAYSLLLNPNGGNVGIGTSSPDEKFVSKGTISIETDGTADKILKFKQGGIADTTGRTMIRTSFDGVVWSLNLGTLGFDPTLTIKSGNITMGSSLISTGGAGVTYFDIYHNTVAGSDNRTTRIGGGGDVSGSRGGFISLYGNQVVGNGGNIRYSPGGSGYHTFDGSVGIGIAGPDAPLHVKGGTGMNSGWNRTLTLEAAFPGIIFNSSNTAWAGLLYDYSSIFQLRLGATSNNVTATGFIAMSFSSSTGAAGFYSTITATNFILSSDRRLKTNIRPLANYNPVRTPYVEFELLSDPGQKRIGVIAQDLEIEHPEFVRTDEKGIKSVAYIDLHSKEINDLKYQLEIMMNKIMELERKLL